MRPSSKDDKYRALKTNTELKLFYFILWFGKELAG